MGGYYCLWSLITTIAIFGVFYAYFGYPLLLLAVNKLRDSQRRDIPTRRPFPPLSLIVTVRNEAGVIREKLENTLSLVYGGESERKGLQIIIASDASDDGTDDIVSEFESRGVELVRLPSRGGKERAQAAAISRAHGEIVVFTDAKVKLEKGALENFVRYFNEPTIGCVSSVDRVSGETGSGEGFYVRYEMWLRRLETQFGSLVGLSGSCFAVRKEVCRGWRTDIPSDFAALIQAKRLGFHGVSAEDVICSYSAVKTEEEEYGRKVRTVLRGITTFISCREMLNPFKYGAFSWQLFSHKLARWLVPIFILISAIGLLVLAGQGGIWSGLFFCGVVFISLAVVGYLRPAMRGFLIVKIPLFFLVTNMGIGAAWIRYFRGERSVAWNPSAKL